MIEKIPILIGVSGHLDIPEQNMEELKNQVKMVLEKVQKKYPNSPIAILSPLAEGADRIVAKVALEYNAKLIVPLPLPVDLYKKDFKDEISTKEFEDLCNQAETIFTLPLVDGNTITDISDYGPARDKQYEQVGLYLIKNCHFLIAMWDGIELNKTGGTSQIINFAINGFTEACSNNSILDSPYTCSVYHISTPRKRHHDLIVDIGAKFLHPSIYQDEGTGENVLSNLLKKTDNLNDDVFKYFLTNPKFASEELAKSKSFLISEAEEKLLSPVDRKILEYYAITDVLSGINQKRTHMALFTLIGLAILAIITFELSAHVLITCPQLLLVYSMIFVLGYLFFKDSQKNDLQGKYLDYRAIAEGLRVQFFWRLGGINENIYDYYLLKQKNELKWVRNIIKYINIKTSYKDEESLDSRVYNLNIVKKNWIEDQYKFFNNKITQNKKKLENNERATKILMSLSILFAACAGIMFAKFPEFRHENENLHGIIITILALLPSFAASFEFYTQKMAFQAQKIRYSKAEITFKRALEHINSSILSNNDSQTKEIIKELGKEALIENGDWVLIHRERPIEMPNLKS